MLRNLIVGLALSAAFALPLANTAEAAIGDGVAASHVASQLLPVEKAQFVWGGRQYCWYDNGWRGPGFYWCGYAYRTGFGWGGGAGWHGWRGGGRGVGAAGIGTAAGVTDPAAVIGPATAAAVARRR